MRIQYYLVIAALIAICSGSFAADKGHITSYVDGTIQAGNNRNFSQITGFIPMMQDQTSLFFTDIRFMKNLPNWKKTILIREFSNIYESNLGFGYRFLAEKDTVIGAAGFFDYRSTDLSKNKSFKQMTLNAHYLTTNWQVQTNAYLPIGNKNITRKMSNSQDWQ